MAVINFFDDIFGEVSKTETYEAGENLKKIINKYVEEKDSIEVACEVYDIDTGETTYIIPEVKEYKTVCIVNGEEQLDLAYNLQEDDVVSFILIPMENSTPAQWFNYLGGALMIAAGVIASIASGGSLTPIGVSLAVSGTMMIVGQVISDVTAKDNKSTSDSKQDKLKEAEDVLGLSGGSNQDIIDHRYPVILGKHLVNPYIVGSYYNETITLDAGGGDGGQYLTQLYCVGYGPLKLTDFKIGDTLLAYNRSITEDSFKSTVMHGLLTGYNGLDTGDILKKWKNNDVQLEILQAGDWNKTDDSKWGNLYPQVVEQIEPNANLINIKDKEIEELANVTYLGTSIPNGFKTNSVRFSRSCPQKLEVELDFPNGLYAYRTYVKKGAEIKYYSLPVTFAIQWRYVKDNQKSSDANSPEGWNNFDYIRIEDGNNIFPSKYNYSKLFFDYNSNLGKKDYLDSDDASTFNFILKDKMLNTDNFTLSSYTYDDKEISGKKWYIEAQVYVTFQPIYTSTDGYSKRFGKKATYVHPETVIIELSDIGIEKLIDETVDNNLKETTFKDISYINDRLIFSDSFKYKWKGESVYDFTISFRNHPSIKILKKNTPTQADVYPAYISYSSTGIAIVNGFSYIKAVRAFNSDKEEEIVNIFKNYSNSILNYPVNKDIINVNERRYVAVKNFSTEECAKMINYDESNDSSIDSVEVRVIRLSPCNLEEYETDYHSIPDDWTGMKYNDLAKWSAFRTFSFDKDKFKEALDNKVLEIGKLNGYESISDIPKDVIKEYKQTAISELNVDNYPLRPITEEDLNKFSYVALRLKQDVAETGGSSLSQLSCIATNFAPTYDKEQKQWLPEGISKSERCYRKYFNEKENKYIIDELSEYEYLDSKLKRKTVSLFKDLEGNTGNEFYKSEYYLSDSGMIFDASKDLSGIKIQLGETVYSPTLDYETIKNGASVKITDGVTVIYDTCNDYEGICIKNESENRQISVYKIDESINPYEYYKTNKGNNYSELIKNEIYSKTTSHVALSNGIDLTDRPKIKGSDMKAKGWTGLDDDDICTIFSSSYTNEEIAGINYPTLGIVVTPILQDGTILTPDELDSAAAEILKNGKDEQGVLLYKCTEYGPLGNQGWRATCVRNTTDEYASILSQLQAIFYLGTDEDKVNLQSLSGNYQTEISIEDIIQYYELNNIKSKFIEHVNNNTIISLIVKEAFFNAAGQMGLIISDMANIRYELSEYADKTYCQQNVASQALYSIIGPHVGIDAKTYDDVNLDSFTKLYKFCEDVTDGTTLGDGEEQQEGYDDRLVHMKYSCNGVISSEIKLEQLLSKILQTGRANLKRDEKNRYEVLLGTEVKYPTGMINKKNIVSQSNSRSYEDEIAGYLVNFVDETDNYTTNSLYVMQDGEDFKNPTHEIAPFSIPYVTDRKQLYSLCRFNLCCKLYQKEAYTRTVGRMGYNISLGDVFLLQDDSLLVGKEHGARITNIIMSNDKKYIYGIEIDDPITFTGEEERFGCTIIQPEKYNSSRCVTLEFCDKDGCEASDGKHILPEIGMTNRLLFKRQIDVDLASYDEETAELVQVLPKVGNLVAFGTINAITEKVQVMGIKPKDKDQFELTLVPYKPELYNMGTKMPVFTSNMTRPSRSEPEIEFTDKPSKYESETALADTSTNIINTVEALIPGAINPSELENVKCVAFKDYIDLSCQNNNLASSDVPAYITWKITRHDGTEFTVTSSGVEYKYYFDRNTDGYPEREELNQWTVSVMNTNSSGLTSEWTEPVYINASDYGTWKLTELQSIDNFVQDRTISLKFTPAPRSDDKVYYGNTKYKIKVQRVCSSDVYDPSIVFPEGFNFDDYNDGDNWYTPSTSQNPYPSKKSLPDGTEVTVTNVNNYKQFDEEGVALTGWLETSSIYTQTMPLIGQGDDSIKIVSTTYGFKIVAYNESGNESNELIVYKTALCTNISDIVHANEYYNDLYVKRLSAISANVGMIEQGGFGDFNNQTNYWALSNLKSNDETGLHKDVFEGEFRVGGKDEFIKVAIEKDKDGNPVLDDDGKYKYSVEIAAGNIDLTSGESGFDGGTYVYDKGDKTKRLKLAYNGVTIQVAKKDADGNVIKDDDGNIIYIALGRFYGDENNNLTFTNEPNDEENSTLPEFGVEVANNTTAQVYHLDNNLESHKGGNPEKVEFDGELYRVDNDFHILENKKGFFVGDLSINMEGQTREVVFWNRTNKVQFGNHLLDYDSNTTDNNANDWNKLLGVSYFKNVKE